MKMSLNAETQSVQKKERTRVIDDLSGEVHLEVPLPLRVDADVVDEHLLGEDGGAVGEPGQSPPTATLRMRKKR